MVNPPLECNLIDRVPGCYLLPSLSDDEFVLSKTGIRIPGSARTFVIERIRRILVTDWCSPPVFSWHFFGFLG